MGKFKGSSEVYEFDAAKTLGIRGKLVDVLQNSSGSMLQKFPGIRGKFADA